LQVVPHPLGQNELATQPDVGTVPDRSDAGAGRASGAESGGSFAPAGSVEVRRKPIVGRFVGRVPPRDWLVLAGRNRRDHLGRLGQRRPARCVRHIPAGPFPPDALLIEHPQEHASDRRPGLEAAFLGIVRPVPVAHRHAVRRFVEETEHRIDESLEVVLVLCQRRRPEDPVELRVARPVVQGQPVGVLHLLVVFHLRAEHLCREQIETEKLIPHEVVFLAPRAGLVERQAVVIAVVGLLDPAGGKLLRQLRVFVCLGLVASHRAELAVGAQAANGLGREVHVVRQVACEVVGAELVLRIEAFGLEVLGPRRQLRPVQTRKVRVALHLRDGGHEDQQIAALLDGHLVLLGALAAAVDLAVGVRVLAQVMRSKREPPSLGRGVVHERHEERFGHRWPEQQKLRGHRVEHVGGPDAAVGVVLLAELQRLAVGVGDELAGREAVPIRQRAEQRILASPGLGQVRHEFLVEGRTAFLQRLIVPSRRLEQILGLPAVTPPVRAKVLLHVLDRVQIVVSEHQPATDRLLGNLESLQYHRRTYVLGGRRAVEDGDRTHAIFEEAGLSGLARGEHAGRHNVLRGRYIQIAPVDSDVVASLGEDRLVLRADSAGNQIAHLLAGPHHLLVRGVDRKFGGSVEVYLDVV